MVRLRFLQPLAIHSHTFSFIEMSNVFFFFFSSRGLLLEYFKICSRVIPSFRMSFPNRSRKRRRRAPSRPLSVFCSLPTPRIPCGPAHFFVSLRYSHCARGPAAFSLPLFTLTFFPLPPGASPSRPHSSLPTSHCIHGESD
jgi:hypothetical protein